MQCAACGASNPVHGPRDLNVEYKGVKAIFKQMICTYCPACRETVFDMAEGQIYMEKVIAFRKTVPVED